MKRIAVPYEETGNIHQHFGHAPAFKLYDTEDGTILSSKIVKPLGSGPGNIANFLVARAVKTVLCGGIGGGAVNAVTSYGIELCAGVQGNADEAVQSYLDGTLTYGAGANCDHHDHPHGHDAP